MFKKIALCAMLVLILAPALVMAAGQQGQGQGIGNEAGRSLNVQHQMAPETSAQEKVQNGPGQGSGSGSQNGVAQLLRTVDQDQSMIRNMTRDQVQLSSDSASAGEHRGEGLNGYNGSENQPQGGLADQKQNRFSLTDDSVQNMLESFSEQLGVQFRNVGESFAHFCHSRTLHH